MFPTRIEIIPSEGIVEEVQAAVPLSTPLTVTCLPHHGIARTMEVSIKLSLLGYNVVPHLSAHGLEHRAQLAGILRDCEVAGIREVFAIGGDGPLGAGPYQSSLPLLADIAEYTGGRITAGIAGYPEGHPSVSGLDLLDALLAKQHLATHVVTQMCFSAPKILDYAALLRREGVELPVWAGVAGAVPLTKLLALATQIGVGTSLKFLSNKGTLALKLLGGDKYSPQSLVSELTAHPEGVSGIHLYSFNRLDMPVWERSELPGAAGSEAAAARPPLTA
ncbi:methylenetetrahydrofolate reductase [Arthrobacter bambusae]|uniref:methylenetetrahydrofolate reductase n=1 Tax=Arthrobacter bambusae TaxID=1338426 RepID=UPI0027843C83|nr:methylenetetrahydrofolate reductase [Arthrobacter bambusae]MDQ0031582.1 methylenetetrahydrofolate reductase (NADPH) [Arthrobacter bambusae]MDQ0099806.1 methylenetetrahydrofolate reductase (NADPH) [Arthrobacter bambusae]